MSSGHVQHVLSLLRRMRAFEVSNPGSATKTFLTVLSGRQDISDTQAVSILAALLHEVWSAKDVINATNLSNDVKNGLNAILTNTANTLSPDRLSQPFVNSTGPLDAPIAMLAMVAHMEGRPDVPTPVPELESLVNDARVLLANLTDSDLDPAIKTVASNHIAALVSMLLAIDVVGIDAALVAYYSLVIRLKRETQDKPDPTGKIAGLWGDVERWAGRLAIIEGIVTHGQTLIGSAEKAIQALPHLPL